MHNNKYILGLDTSNYTTSIAIVDGQKNLLYDCREILIVKSGKRGLRQSEAFFQHINNLPNLLNQIPAPLLQQITKISVTNKPRPLPNSYMPVFRAGESLGKSLAHTLNCEYTEFSHQEGHIEAAKWSIGKALNMPFIAVHISGGTTEILMVEKDNDYYKISIIGGTSDISAGQFIDRIGVRLGFRFPCGKAMDNTIITNKQDLNLLPTAVNGGYMSFSGPETEAYKLIEKGYRTPEIVYSVFKSIAKSLSKTIINIYEETGINQVLIFGGVASSHFIREYFYKNFNLYDITVLWGEPKYCSDNAVGTALLAIDQTINNI